MKQTESNHTKIISCEVIQDLLPLYHDHVCSQKSSALVESHLAKCADCQKMLHELNNDHLENNLMREAGDVIKKHRKKERSIAFKTGIIIAGILLLPVIIAILITLPGYSDWKINAVLIASMLLVAGLTVVPLVSARKRISKMILFSTAALLLIIFFTEIFFYHTGFLYFAQTAFSIIFGLSLPLFPVLLWQSDLPETLKNHKALLSISWDTLWFYLMIFAFCIGYPDAMHDLILVPSIFASVIWGVFLIIRYLAFHPLIKTGCVVAICGTCVSIGNAIGWMTFMGQNIHTIIGLVSTCVTAVFVILGIVMTKQKK